MPPSYSTDIVIFGGGVAGLWLLNRLGAEGYRAILLERDRLGGGQSIHSQGIIHGGLKYALHGALGGASRAIADMPRRWRDCIGGHGEIDLSACRVLSGQYYMWSGPGFGSSLKSFFGSKAVAGRTAPAAAAEIPAILRGRGAVYRLPDFVIDGSSLIKALAAPHRSRIYACAADSMAFVANGERHRLRVSINQSPVELDAQRFIFCAGAGNAELIKLAGVELPRHQLRPLKMVSVCGASLPSLYLHALPPGLGVNPEVTITTHANSGGDTVWYLGGDLAETGAARSDGEQERFAQRLLRRLFPALDLENPHWRCLDIERAEPADARGARPDNATIWRARDLIVAWPVKLSLTPVLGDLVLESLRKDGIAAGAENSPPEPARAPPFARPFWD